MSHFTYAVVILLIGITSVHTVRSQTRVVTDVAYLASDRTEKLDLYLPAPSPAGQLCPGFVWIHGGGWKDGAKGESRAKEVCTTLADAGYVAVCINYQQGDTSWPQNLLDCKNAVRFLRAHATEYRIDPDRIGVGGGSAGGHLSLMVGFTAGDERLEPSSPYPGVSSAVGCVIDLCGPADFILRREYEKTEVKTEEKWLVRKMGLFGAASGDPAVNDAALRAASPVSHIKPNSPPVFIVHGRADPTINYGQAEQLARVLTAHHVEHNLVLLDGVGHTFNLEFWGKKPLPRDLRPEVLVFLAKHLVAAPGSVPTSAQVK